MMSKPNSKEVIEYLMFTPCHYYIILPPSVTNNIMTFLLRSCLCLRPAAEKRTLRVSGNLSLLIWL